VRAQLNTKDSVRLHLLNETYLMKIALDVFESANQELQARPPPLSRQDKRRLAQRALSQRVSVAPLLHG
jgi:hypothetical protein